MTEIGTTELLSTNGNMSEAQLDQKKQEKAQERRQRCLAEIQEALKRNNCILDPFCIVRSGRAEVIVDVKPL